MYILQSDYHHSISYHLYHVMSSPFLFLLRTVKIYSLSNFQGLLTIITVLNIRDPELVNLITGSFYTLTSLSPFLSFPTPAFVSTILISVL